MPSLLYIGCMLALTSAVFASNPLIMDMVEQEKSDCEFKFASYYQNNMVLQREPQRSIIWGFGVVGATVNISLMQDVRSTKVVKVPGQSCGVWKVTLKPYKAGPSYDIQGVHDDHGRLHWLLLKNLLFGDVWVCGGQSNMEFTMTQILNSTAELNDSEKYKNIRVFKTKKIYSGTPFVDLQGIDVSWSLPSAKTLGNGTFTYFSAVCWLYGKYLYQQLQVPIGLVESCWGGTPVEAWSNMEALTKCGLEKFNPDDLPPDAHEYSLSIWNSSYLWNSMIQPLTNMTIKGAIWYQGEANTEYHTTEYNCSFPTMISQWRDSWHEGTQGQTGRDFPFGFVQLCDRTIKDNGNYPVVRWHQTADYGYVPNNKMPNTFMSVAMDLIDHSSPYSSIHPRYKQDVAQRLVESALSIAYKRSTVFDGPFPELVIFDKNNADTVTVQYSRYQNIVAKDTKSFQVCCASSDCSAYDLPSAENWYSVAIVMTTDHTVVLDGSVCPLKTISVVAAVRYAWSITPCTFKGCSVYNTEGLPGPAFYKSVDGK